MNRAALFDRAGWDQLVKFAFVGISRNTLSYLIYLAITSLGIDPKIVMSFLYIIGTTVSFLVNRRWTFSHEGSLRRSVPRFVLAYLLGYLINLSLLLVFVDHMGFPHQLVQPVAIVVVALYLFLMLRFFVFSRPVRTMENPA